MKRIALNATTLFAFIAFTTGCTLSPVKNEIPLVKNFAAKATNPNETKVVIFNESNMLLHGIDKTGRLNVTLDGKGVAQLDLGEYVQIIVPQGKHEVNLEHRDMALFRSKHDVEFPKPETYLKVRATPVSNEALVVPELPAQFDVKFRPAAQVSP
jgi:hypothetical protein